MATFKDFNSAASAFNEAVMGESFSYTAPGGGSPVTGLTGIFNQQVQAFEFAEASQRRTVTLICVASKPQWGSTVPANRGTVTYGGVAYTIHEIGGIESADEPCYELTLKRLT